MHTFHSIVVCAISLHVWYCDQLKLALTVGVFEYILNPRVLFGIGRGATHSLAILDELVCDMRPNETVNPCDQYSQAL